MKLQVKPQGVQVNVKLAPSADKLLAVQKLSVAPGVRNVLQTFPGETDQRLANLYILEVNASEVKSALRRLRRIADVEYAEVSAPRKLIR
jgi:hypothetical protein